MESFKVKQIYTDRSSDSLRIYLKEINKYPVLSSDEEDELVQLIVAGDQNAKEKLINSNLRFVVTVAKQYQNQGLPLVDLINEGNLGLIKAVGKFDPTRGFKFISYAVWWIRQSIMKAIADLGKVVRIPVSQSSVISKINKASEKFEQEYERKPSITELVELTGLDTDAVEDYVNKQFFTGSSSLNSPTAEDETMTLEDVIPSKDVNLRPDLLLMNDSLSNDLKQVFTNLSDIETYILCSIFGLYEEKGVDDLSLELNITVERVRQIKNRAIDKIRKSQNVEILKKYLG
ncbi:MAG: sigma-70 family RNA polymerase sigma factor [Bacillota bacterium]|nr:sigma-70 family RNA polymerase sigma factor [Bacillota bacterium]